MGMSASAADLQVGDILPNCSKIPLVGIDSAYKPALTTVQSIETSLLSNGVAIVHFCSPRPPRAGSNEASFFDQISDLQKGALSVTYPCSIVAVVPFGEKGRADSQMILAQNQDKLFPTTQVNFEPTYPRPGLYRTFRSGASGEEGTEISTPWTYLIGPGRKILAIRPPDSQEPLFNWLEKNLPKKVSAVINPPSTELSVPNADTWIWPTFRRNVGHETKASMLPDVLPYTYLAWEANVGRTFATPAVVDNVVYISTDSKGLQSLALGTGQALMNYPTGAAWWSSPVVAEGLVYSISAQGEVFAIDRGGFGLKWRRNLNGLITSSPIISGGSMYVGSRNGVIYALDAANGEILWQFQTGGEISSSPAIAKGMVIIGSGDRNVYAIDAKSGEYRWATPTNGPVDSSPSVADNDVFIGSFDGSMYSLKLSDGTVNWRCELGGWVHSSPAVDEGTVFVGTVNFKHDDSATWNWIDRKNGKRLGSFAMPDAVYSSPTVWGDLVLVGCRDHNLYAFDRKMRQTQPAWTYKTRSYVHSSPVVVGDTVLVASFDGILHALRMAKPIRIWKDDDVAPRWFVAAMTHELHKEVADLVAKGSGEKVGATLSLRKFEDVFAEIRSSSANQGKEPKTLPRDVPSEHPGSDDIAYVLSTGLLTGYPDGTFRPDEPTTRYQFSFGMATAIESISRPDFAWKFTKKGASVEVRIQPVIGRSQVMPTDVAQNHWAFRALSTLAEKTLIPIDEEGQYRGNKILTIKDAALHWKLLVDSIKIVRTK